MHDFEARGLGKAPFHFVDWRVARNKTGRCARCDKPLKYEFVIGSSDGKQFTVGSECVKKLDEAPGLMAEAIERRANRADELLKDARVKNHFRSMPHPKGRANESFLDWIEFIRKNGGKDKNDQISHDVIGAATTLGVI